jgi:hypothetical protein
MTAIKKFVCSACPKISCTLSIESDYNLGGPYQCPVFDNPGHCKGCNARGNIKDWKEVKS